MHIVLPEGFGGGLLVLYDVQGRRAAETKIPENQAQRIFTLYTPHLKPGMYLLEVEGKDGRVWRKKVMKKH